MTLPARRHITLGNVCQTRDGSCDLPTHRPRHALPMTAVTFPTVQPPGRHRRLVPVDSPSIPTRDVAIEVERERLAGRLEQIRQTTR